MGSGWGQGVIVIQTMILPTTVLPVLVQLRADVCVCFLHITIDLLKHHIKNKLTNNSNPQNH